MTWVARQQGLRSTTHTCLGLDTSAAQIRAQWEASTDDVEKKQLQATYQRWIVKNASLGGAAVLDAVRPPSVLLRCSLPLAVLLCLLLVPLAVLSCLLLCSRASGCALVPLAVLLCPH